jgi:DNA-binding CsgD family transcriptional regulator
MYHTILGQPTDARHAFARAREAYRVTEHPFQRAVAALCELYEVVWPYLADQPAELHQLAREAAHAWARSSGVWTHTLHELTHLPLLWLAGDWQEARRRALEATAARGLLYGPLFAARVLGLLGLHQGQSALLYAQVQALLPDGPRTTPGDTWLLPALALQRMAAAQALGEGDLLLARAWLAAHDSWLAWSGAVLGQADGQLAWATYHCASGDAAAACDCAGRALELATEPRQPLALLAAHRLLGELATAAECADEAAHHLEAALALATACTAPYERALTLLALARLRADTGDAATARDLLGEVRAMCAPLGAQPALAQAEALARTLHAPPTRRPTYPAGLSQREVEVLALVAEGITNGEVSARLVVSPRTVEQHLRSIYNKLGVSSRAAATRFAVEQQLAARAPAAPDGMGAVFPPHQR